MHATGGRYTVHLEVVEVAVEATNSGAQGLSTISNVMNLILQLDDSVGSLSSLNSNVIICAFTAVGCVVDIPLQ